MEFMLSVSVLSGYLYCPRKVYLQYALKIFEPPKPALVLGSIRHSVFEEANKADEEIVKGLDRQMDLEDVFSRYKERYMKILKDSIIKNKPKIDEFSLVQDDVFESMAGSVIEEARQRSENVFRFMEKNNVFGEELWQKLTPKILSEFGVQSDALGLRGIVDKIEIYEDFMIPIELKTGKAPDEGAWPSHKLQIAAYMAMLNEKTREVRCGKLVYLDHNKTVEIVNNPFIEEEVKAAIERAKALLSSKMPPDFVKSGNKCDACGLKRQCHDEGFINNRLRMAFRSSK